MAFNNPILAGEVLVRSGMKSENFQAGESGWRVTRKGNAEFNDLNSRGNTTGDTAAYENVHANAKLFYKGNELQGLLDVKGGELIALGQIPIADRPFTTQVPILEIQGPTKADFAYEIVVEGMRCVGPTGERVNCIVYMTWDGSDPWTSSSRQEQFIDEQEFTSSGIHAFKGTAAFYGNDGTCRMVLTVSSIFGAECTLRFDPPLFYLKNIGKPVINTAVDRYAGSAPSKRHRTFDILAYRSESYSDRGLRNTNGRMYQGYTDYDPGGGFNSSFAFFDEGTVDELIGVADADIDYVRLELFFEHWHYYDHGTAVVGMFHHGGAQFPDQYHVFYPGGRNTSETADVSVGMINAMQNGNFHGIMIGPAAAYDPEEDYYGYAHGATMVHPPRLIASYWK